MKPFVCWLAITHRESIRNEFEMPRAFASERKTGKYRKGIKVEAGFSAIYPIVFVYSMMKLDFAMTISRHGKLNEHRL